MSAVDAGTVDCGESLPKASCKGAETYLEIRLQSQRSKEGVKLISVMSDANYHILW